MAPRTLHGIAGPLVALILLWLGAFGEQSGDSASRTSQQPAGFYPPAPSKAVGMTPQWRAFADSVDRICATSYNRSLGIDAHLRQVASLRGWSERRLEQALLGVWNDQARTILRSTEALGEPPRRADLFARWRANVAKRAVLRRRAAQAVGQGHWPAYRAFMNRLSPLKDRSDEIGQRFGLRICTSN